MTLFACISSVVRKTCSEGVSLLTLNSFQTGSKNPPNQKKVSNQTILKNSKPFFCLRNPNYLVWWLWTVVKRETKQEMAKLNGKKKKRKRLKKIIYETDRWFQKAFIPGIGHHYNEKTFNYVVKVWYSTEMSFQNKLLTVNYQWYLTCGKIKYHHILLWSFYCFCRHFNILMVSK